MFPAGEEFLPQPTTSRKSTEQFAKILAKRMNIRQIHHRRKHFHLLPERVNKSLSPLGSPVQVPP